jgi:hypothetical protein
MAINPKTNRHTLKFFVSTDTSNRLHIAAACRQKKDDDGTRNENQRHESQLKNHFEVEATKKTCDKIHVSPIPELNKKQGKSIFLKNQCLSYPVPSALLCQEGEKNNEVL